jgi:hypothetical protein
MPNQKISITKGTIAQTGDSIQKAFEKINANSAYLDTISLVFPSVAYLRLNAVETTLAYAHVAGYNIPGDRGGGLYIKVAAEPSHPGKFLNPNGWWYELIAQSVTPEMFGAFGSDVGAVDVDETVQIQNMADYAMYYGCTVTFHGLSGTRKFSISRTIKFNATRSPTTLGFDTSKEADQTDISTAPSAHFSNHPEVSISGVGNCMIRAMAPMDLMFWFLYDYTAPNSLQPYWLKIDGLKLNGNNLADKGLKCSWMYRLNLEHFRIFGVGTGLILDHVGVSDVSKFLIYAKDTCIDAEFGGDDQIHDGEFWPVRCGVRCGGGTNTKIYANTFTAWKYNSTPTPYSFGVQVLATPATADYGSRDVDIFNNEFCDFDFGVYGVDTTTDPEKDIYSFHIDNNHVIRTYKKPNARLVRLDGARGGTISGNNTGDRDWEGYRSVDQDITLNNCQGISIIGGALQGSSVPAIVLTGCKGIAVIGVTFNNICAGQPVDGPGRVEIIDSSECIVDNCPVIIVDKNGNPVACSEHVTIERGQSDNNRFTGCPHPATWQVPYYVTGANTVFGDLQPQRLPRPKASLPPANTVAIGSEMMVTDGPNGFGKVYSTGTGWRYSATDAGV